MLRVTCFLVHQVKILHTRAQGGPDLIPPSFMYDTTVVLSVATSTILLSKGLGTLLKPERLLKVLDSLYTTCFPEGTKGPRWQSGNTLASHLCGRGSIPVMAVSGKAGSCLPLVGSLQYRTLANYMYWFPLPFQLPVVI